MKPTLSIIVPTRNEARNIGNCLESLRAFPERQAVELIVVDNHSTDETAAIARSLGARVFEKGPERSAQRNFGVAQAAANFVLFVDADMLVSPELVAEILSRLGSPDCPDGFFIPETIAGKGFWGRVRNFERSFYNATVVDALRVIRKAVFLQAGGYDERLYAGEDWDLDRRIFAITRQTAMLEQPIVHNEAQSRFAERLGKRRRYGRNFELYRQKWQFDAVTRKQFGPAYRLFGVFFEHGKWKRSVRHPVLLLAVWVYKVLDASVFLIEGWKTRREQRRA